MKESIQAIYLREDSRLVAFRLKVDEMASSIITKWNGKKRDESYLLVHRLMKPVFNFPGIKDGTRALLISSRDVRFDPLKELDESWDADHIRARLKEIAKEQQHKAEQSKNSEIMGGATLMLAGSALLLFILVCVIAGMKYIGD